MRRTTTTDGGSRYLVSLPFARELADEERAGLREALERPRSTTATSTARTRSAPRTSPSPTPRPA